MSEVEDLESSAEPAEKSKKVMLKQFIAVGISEDGSDRKIAYFLATCGRKAREAFAERYEGYDIIEVQQSAFSEKTADWLKTHESFQWEA